jgi:hypothetical protein
VANRGRTTIATQSASERIHIFDETNEVMENQRMWITSRSPHKFS